ncbi:hypothetical protein ORV05_11510 [Amycolatopsis cynarae]|uniref:Sortase n=1 Tax=Amycolatopsis cynarae TaxID=2995223 RepID=A0ABY7B8T1_9PSEU|nr:hypothetical protein [Amycolatopsis sp. HUAS 11-8]WAL68360.1 hypothetical protein ORV05_11510 [Amycolatopsis sp. HUAS 11-8]
MRLRADARVAVFAAVLLSLTAALAAPVAAAAPLGGLVVTPGEGADIASVRLLTSGGCPPGADAYNATLTGHGLPAAGQVITATTDAGLSHTAPFEVFPVETLRDFAADNNTTLTGDYRVTVSCVDSFAQQSKGEFSATLRIPAPGRYLALGSAKGPDRVQGSTMEPAAPESAGQGGAVPSATAEPPATGRSAVAAPGPAPSTVDNWFPAAALVVVLGIAAAIAIPALKQARARRRDG